MPAEPLRDFLISYHTADRAWMEWISWQLEGAGYSTLVKPRDDPQAIDFIERVQPATLRAERTVVLLSPEYLSGVASADDWQKTFSRDPNGEKGVLIPLCVDVTNVRDRLPELASVDLVGLNVREVRERLVSAAGGIRSRAPVRERASASALRLKRGRPHFPGAAPRIWNVPFARNPCFAGRETLMRDLETALSAGRPAALVQTIHGLGGIGKRQIAVEYAYRHESRYDAVFWVNARSRAAFREGLASLAALIGLTDQVETGQAVAVDAVLLWLSEQDRWLLILKDAAAPNDIADLLPRDATGEILITSRHPQWETAATAFPVPVLPRSAAIEVFERRMPEADSTAAAILASELGDFPLALAQAAGYVASARVTVAAFRDLFRNRRSELWKSGAGPDDYPRTIATLWDMAIRRMPEAVVELIRLCAHLGPEGIPLWLLADFANDLPRSLRAAAGNPLQRRACVNDLCGLGLIEATEEIVWVHPLLQAVISEHLPEYERRRFVHMALRLVSAAFHVPADEPWIIDSVAPLLPHALAVLARAQAQNVAPGLSGRLADRVGSFFRQRGNLAEARRLLEQAIAFKQRAHTADHPALATSYSNLALVELAQENLPEALRLSQRALSIDIEAYPADHPTLAIGYSNLGLVEHALGNLAEAQRLILAAIGIFHKARVSDHPDLASCHFHLSLVEQDAGNPEAALDHMRRACTMRLARLGERHFATQAAIAWLKQHDPEFRRSGSRK